MPLWLDRQPLVLASKSDVRGKLLAAAGLRFEIRPAHIDERAVEAKAGPIDAAAAARLLARAKALAVAATRPGQLVLGADQTLARGAIRFSKPANRDVAAEQLRALRGRTHELHSALALARDATVLFDCVDTARLTMRDISDRFLDDYLAMAGDAALLSVGGYQLEGIGVHLFEKIEGDYFTILGLPLLPLLGFLRQNKFVDG
ncbi:MAG: Maf family protein [Rhizobiales bacterium]|jgi:septum formation protein|nr:Maf family protein [Hyphomicrobiales bacterium]